MGILAPQRGDQQKNPQTNGVIRRAAADGNQEPAEEWLIVVTRDSYTTAMVAGGADAERPDQHRQAPSPTRGCKWR